MLYFSADFETKISTDYTLPTGYLVERLQATQTRVQIYAFTFFCFERQEARLTFANFLFATSYLQTMSVDASFTISDRIAICVKFS